MTNSFSTRLYFLIVLITGSVAAQSAPPRKNIPAIAKAANGAVVSIVMSDKDGNPIAQGSGFLVSKDGVILTNYHVIAEGSSAVVKLPDGAFYVVDGVLAFDKARDVAIIKAHGENFRTLTLGNSDRVQVGQEVVAIGNPLSLESTVSNGIVSSIRTIEDEGEKYLQVTAPISPGSSGGPLFNMAGEVIGITTMYIKGGENLNFAIPINDAKHLLLANSAKLRDFPNESEPAQAQTHDGDTSPPATSSTPVAQTNPSDRDYYKQLYDAGGFSKDTPDYVCFSDDAYSGTFFTFFAGAYDKDYAGALDMIETLKTLGSYKDLDVEKKAEADSSFIVINSTQEKAPYVNFLGRDTLNSLSSDGQTFYRNGGRSLYETVYQKGVKVNTLAYKWNGTSWFLPVPPTDPNAEIKISKTLYLSIEPTTMRYVDSAEVTVTVGDGETAATNPRSYGPWPGTCEKLPAKQ